MRDYLGKLRKFVETFENYAGAIRWRDIMRAQGCSKANCSTIKYLTFRQTPTCGIGRRSLTETVKRDDERRAHAAPRRHHLQGHRLWVYALADREALQHGFSGAAEVQCNRGYVQLRVTMKNLSGASLVLLFAGLFPALAIAANTNPISGGAAGELICAAAINTNGTIFSGLHVESAKHLATGVYEIAFQGPCADVRIEKGFYRFVQPDTFGSPGVQIVICSVGDGASGHNTIHVGCETGGSFIQQDTSFTLSIWR